MKARLCRIAILLCGFMVLLKPAGGEPNKGHNVSPVTSGKHALLVGCTKYPALSPRKQLEGPANDVHLMRRLLVEKFRFPEKNIVILSEEAGKSLGETYRPTRQNIKREFHRLARTAKAGDQVVILLSGHGSQQPEPNPPPDPKYAEADGQDEVFLPADIGPWEDASVKNAIVDDELRVWTQAIVEKGAFLFFVADCCQSGTLLRGSEVARQVDPEELKIPKEAIQAARKRAEARNKTGENPRGRGREPKLPFHLDVGAGKLAAIYAARSSEPTVELPLPKGKANARPYGLLTFHLCQVLMESQASLTYRELVQRIQHIYEGQGRTFPIPLVEGGGRDFAVLGQQEWPGRSQFLLSKDDDNHWQVNGGFLHGLTEKSILAVFPPSGQAKSGQLAGHVYITAAGPFTATVKPCAFGKMAPIEKLPIGGRCQPVFIDFGDSKLRVAVDRSLRGIDKPGKAVAGPEAALLRELEKEKGSLVQAVADPMGADWLLRPGKSGLELLPARGLLRKRDSQETVLGPFPATAMELQKRLWPIARVSNLRRLARQQAGETVRQVSRLKVQVDLVKFANRQDRKGKVVPWHPYLVLRDGEIVAFQITNRTQGKKLYVSLLYLDAGYKIAPRYPGPNDVQEPLAPGRSVQTGRIKIQRPWGLESLLVIAVAAQGLPPDFTVLAQPSLQQARSLDRGVRALNTPLGLLLQNACFGEGQRGGSPVDAQDYVLALHSWLAEPRKKIED